MSRAGQRNDGGTPLVDGVGQTQEMDGIGRFGWVTDLEGNRVVLWQPS